MSASDLQLPLTAEQLRKIKLTRRGISFNMLLIGENGTGKRAFINTLCDSQCFPVVTANTDEEVVYADGDTSFQIDTHIIQVHEPNSVPIKLRVNLTRNFGYNLENSDNPPLLQEYIRDQFQRVLDEELKVNRSPRLEDNRIHVALYFLTPNARGLSEFDIACMQAISDIVNLIPVLAKADTLTRDELLLNKNLVNESIAENGISVYNFTEYSCDSPESVFAEVRPPYVDSPEEDSEYLARIQESMPFSIVSANEKAGIHAPSPGALIRRTPWGDVYLEDEMVCDFTLLKNVVFGSHIQELREVTIASKYERFRIDKLTQRE